VTLDQIREIALIQISQSQRNAPMTIIDTALYANGALRLSRHGAGKGGNVLTHLATNSSVEISDEGAERIDEVVRNMIDSHPPRNQWSTADVFRHMQSWYPQR
jgi:hypothetical protein